jgi:transcription factor SPT20
MIVELLDYRAQRKGKNAPTPERPERTRVVLHPTSESLWADICLLGHKFGDKWTDQDALEIEARLLVRLFSFSFSHFLSMGDTAACHRTPTMS